MSQLYTLLTIVSVLTFSLGNPVATSFVAFPETAVDGLSRHALKSGSDVFFGSHQSSTATLHKLSFSTSSPLVLKSLTLKSTTSGRQSSTSIAAISSSFGVENLGALALETGEIVLFDEDLALRSVFTLPLLDITQKAICTGLVFNSEQLVCFGNGTLIVMKVTASSSTGLSFLEQWLSSETSTTDSTTFSVVVTQQYQVKWSGQTVKEMTNASFVNGSYYFTTKVVSAFDDTVALLLGKVEESFSTLAFQKIGDFGADLSSLSMEVIEGNNDVIFYSMKSPASTSDPTEKISISMIEGGRVYSKYFYIDELANSEIGSQSFVVSGDEVITFTSDQIHLTEVSTGLQEKWTRRLVSNNCAPFKLENLVPFGSEYLALGYVESPTENITQSSFLQVLKLNSSGDVDDNDFKNNFYMDDLSVSWQAVTSSEVSWLQSTLKSMPESKVMGSSVAVSNGVASEPRVAATTAIKVNRYLQPTTIEELESGISLVGMFDDSLSIVSSGLDWLKISDKNMLSGSPNGLPTGNCDTMMADIFAYTSVNPLLRCARAPLAIETVSFNGNENSFAKMISSGLTASAPVDIHGTVNGDFTLMAKSATTRFIVSRLYSTGNINTLIQVTSEESGFSQERKTIAVHSTFNQYVALFGDDTIAFFDQGETRWVRKTTGKMSIETIGELENMIIAFGNQQFFALDVSTGAMLNSGEVAFLDFGDYNFDFSTFTFGKSLFFLVHNSQNEVIVAEFTNLFEVKKAYHIDVDLQQFSFVEGSTMSSLIMTANHSGTLVVMSLEFTAGYFNSMVETNVFYQSMMATTSHGASNILVATRNDSYIFDLVTNSLMKINTSIASMDCSTKGATQTDAGFIFLLGCSPLIGRTSLVIVTVTRDGRISPNTGKTVSQKFEPQHSLHQLFHPNAVRVATPSTQTNEIVTSSWVGYLFTTSADLEVGSGMLKYDPPKSLPLFRQDVYLGQNFSHTVTTDLFGSNLGACEFWPFHDIVNRPRSSKTFTLEIPSDRSSATFVWNGLAPEARLHEIEENSVVLRCNGWVSATSSMQIYVTQEREEDNKGDAAQSFNISTLIPSLFAFIAFYF